ncbi:MAG: DUF72 domain-containing protein [Pseudomonadota bacterium]
MPLLAGSASWTDPTLIACGRFYPPAARSAEERLRFYATQFPLAEVDSSYYALPSARNAQRWAERTPPGFMFDLKAFRLFTGHATPAASWPADLRGELPSGAPLRYREVPHELRQELWHRFRQALVPLHAAGKLGAVLFQFSPAVRAGAPAEVHLEHCVDMMAGATCAFEFRHRSWFDGAQNDRTLALERALGAVHVVVDAPQSAGNSVPAVWAATRADLAIVRLHGRNTAAWNAPAAASSGRFQYDYSEAELAAMLPELRRLDASVEQLHVVLNTNYRDQGQANARRLLALW